MVAIQVKPRLSIYLKQRICQLRLIHSRKPFSIDKILNQVSLEAWDPLPSRGTVQNIVHNLLQFQILYHFQITPTGSIMLIV